MKKALFCAFILNSLTLSALPIGNPSEASLINEGLVRKGHHADPCDPCINWLQTLSIRLGFYGDYVFNRHLEIDEDHLDKDIEHTELYTNALYLAANFWDRLDCFVTLGATNLLIETNNSAFGLDGSGRFELETDTDFSWSIGIRGTIWECGCTNFGGEAQYFYTNPTIARLTREENVSLYPNNSTKYQEWQIGVGLSHRINYLVPYLAIKWGHSILKTKNSTFNFGGNNAIARLFNLDSKKDWGYAVGISLVNCYNSSLTIEGRFGDEEAVYLNGQMRF